MGETTRNEITGDKIQSKVTTDAYRSNPFWDRCKKCSGCTKSSTTDTSVLDSIDTAGDESGDIQSGS